MPSLKVEIMPFEIPEFVFVRIPGQQDAIEVPLDELDEETVAGLLEEFSAAVLAKVSE